MMIAVVVIAPEHDSHPVLEALSVELLTGQIGRMKCMDPAERNDVVEACDVVRLLSEKEEDLVVDVEASSSPSFQRW